MYINKYNTDKLIILLYKLGWKEKLLVRKILNNVYDANGHCFVYYKDDLYNTAYYILAITNSITHI